MYMKVFPTITANDLKASREFYERALGFEVVEKWEHEGQVMGLQMRAGGVDLYLSQDDFAKGKDREKGVGMRFFLVCDNVDAAAQRVEQSGYEFTQPLADQDWGSRDFVVTDPDGFVISVSQPAVTN